MNTLSKTITGAWFASPEGYIALEERWSQITNSSARKQLTATDHLLYAVLRGKDWRKGLAPIGQAQDGRQINHKGARKLANGGWYCSGLFLAVSGLTDRAWASFLARIGDGIIEDCAITTLRKIISSPGNHSLPFVAYNERAIQSLALMAKAEVAHV